MFIVPWYGFSWWPLGLIPCHFPFPVAFVVGLCVFCLSLLRLLCVWSPRSRVGLPLPLFVGWFASVSDPVLCPEFVWYSPAAALPSGPPSPWRLVVLISGSEGFPGCLRLDIWLLWQRSGRLAGLHSCLLLTGLEMEIWLLPCVFVLYGNKGFGPVWGTALYTMLCLAFVVFGFPL